MAETKRDNGSVLERFLSYALEVPVCCLTEPENQLADFERRHCFLEQVQPMLLAENMQWVFSGAHGGRIYELRDVLGVRLLLFLYEDRPYIVGPYVTEEWEDGRGEQILASLELPASFILPYKLYYCAYRLLDENTPERIVSAAITALSPEEPPYLRQALSGLPGRNAPDMSYREPPDFDMVAGRYEQENRFLEMVSSGRTKTALKEWKQLERMPSDDVFAPDGRLSTMIANATIFRTLLRKAAERGGAPLAVVDAISLSYAQKTYALRDMREISGMMAQMVEDFSEAVRDSMREKYSPPVEKTLTYIKLHMDREFTIGQLADAAGLSADRLSRRFKAETGDTVKQYIAKCRCTKAAELLQNSELPVQDIGAYVGYLDNNYFSKVFRGIYGISPGDFRKNHGKISQ